MDLLGYSLWVCLPVVTIRKLLDIVVREGICKVMNIYWQHLSRKKDWCRIVLVSCHEITSNYEHKSWADLFMRNPWQLLR